jgi:hypothetical protein
VAPLLGLPWLLLCPLVAPLLALPPLEPLLGLPWLLLCPVAPLLELPPVEPLLVVPWAATPPAELVLAPAAAAALDESVLVLPLEATPTVAVLLVLAPVATPTEAAPLVLAPALMPPKPLLLALPGGSPRPRAPMLVPSPRLLARSNTIGCDGLSVHRIGGKAEALGAEPSITGVLGGLATGAVAESSKLSIRRRSCGRNFSQPNSFAKRAACSLEGLLRSRSRRTPSRLQISSEVSAETAVLGRGDGGNTISSAALAFEKAWAFDASRAACAGAAYSKLSIRRASCGRNFAQPSSFAKRATSTLEGPARSCARRSSSRLQISSGPRIAASVLWEGGPRCAISSSVPPFEEAPPTGASTSAGLGAACSTFSIRRAS